MTLPNHSFASKITEDYTDQNTVVRIGTLDVDCSYPSPEAQAAGQEKVRIVVRSDRQALQLDDFEQREKTMISEAVDHNNLLQELCKIDKEYELSLHGMYYRKIQVSNFLQGSATWQKLATRIQNATEKATGWHRQE